MRPDMLQYGFATVRPWRTRGWAVTMNRDAARDAAAGRGRGLAEHPVAAMEGLQYPDRDHVGEQG